MLGAPRTRGEKVDCCWARLHASRWTCPPPQRGRYGREHRRASHIGAVSKEPMTTRRRSPARKPHWRSVEGARLWLDGDGRCANLAFGTTYRRSDLSFRAAQSLCYG